MSGKPFLSFIAPGIPVAKGRPRFARMGKFVKTFTDDKTVRFEDCIAFYCREAMQKSKHGFPVDVAVHAEITALFPRPASRKKAAHMDRKPDLDNVCKSVIDGLSNAGAVTNDARIVSIDAKKEYGEMPETVVHLSLVEDD